MAFGGKGSVSKVQTNEARSRCICANEKKIATIGPLGKNWILVTTKLITFYISFAPPSISRQLA